MSDNHPERLYGGLFSWRGFTCSYLPLLETPEETPPWLPAARIMVEAEEVGVGLPAEFHPIQESCRYDSGPKCSLRGLDRFQDGVRVRLHLTEYLDYLKSGQHLDDPAGDGGETFRERYARPPGLDWAKSPLTNICGVGVHVITGDERVLVSRQAAGVKVNPGRYAYTAGGTMEWSNGPHPAEDARCELEEEVAIRVAVESLGLVGLGFDTRRLYAQFSFAVRVDRSAEELVQAARGAVDFAEEIESVEAVPLAPGPLGRILGKGIWEPSAAAALVVIGAHHWGWDGWSGHLPERWV